MPPDDESTRVGLPPFDDDEKTPVPSLPAQAKSPSPSPSTQKLQSVGALQSLSLDAQKERSTAGRSKLPWVLLILCVGGMGGFQYYTQYYKPRVVGPAPTATSEPESGTPAAPKGPGGIQVETIRSIKNERGQLRAAGYVAARTPIVVGATVPGQVARLLVSEGDKVKRNQVIAQLDDRVAQSEQLLAVAKKRDAARTLARVKKLLDANSATMTDYEKAQGQLEIAEAEARMISQRIELAKIRAPTDGTILEEVSHAGQVISGSEAIVKMADFSKLVAEIDVNEGDLTKVRVGQEVSVTSEAFAEQTFQGKVKEISEQADRAKGTVIVRVAMQVPQNTLRPGMSVKAVFSIAGDEKPRIVIAKSAVDNDSVWVVGNDGAVALRKVTSQLAGPSTVEVLSGLSEGERVVVQGAAGLKPGQKVP